MIYVGVNATNFMNILDRHMCASIDRASAMSISIQTVIEFITKAMHSKT